MREVTTVKEADVLVRVGTLILLRTGSVIPEGTVLQVGEIERRLFDHKIIMALPFEFRGQTFYILARDVGEHSGDELVFK